MYTHMPEIVFVFPSPKHMTCSGSEHHQWHVRDLISSHLIHSRMIRYPVVNYVFVFVSICACMCDDGSWIWRSKLRRMHGRHAPNSMSADREQLSLHPCRCHRCLMNSCSSAAQVRNAIRLRFSRAHMYYGRRYSYALELLHFVITIATRIMWSF